MDITKLSCVKPDMAYNMCDKQSLDKKQVFK